MALKITELTALPSGLQPTDTVYVVRSSTDYKATGTQLGATNVLGVFFTGDADDFAVGTAKATFTMPNFATTLTAVYVSCKTAPTGSVATFDLNENGTTVLSTKITIDAGEKTSLTAATPPVISDSAIAAAAEMTIDIDGVGSTVAGGGGMMWLEFTRV